MAFDYTITNRVPLNPAEKRKPAGPLYMMWGTFTSSAGGTGGAIDTQSELVHHFQCSSPTGLLGFDIAIAAGVVTLVTTADYVGTWFAIVKDRK